MATGHSDLLSMIPDTPVLIAKVTTSHFTENIKKLQQYKPCDAVAENLYDTEPSWSSSVER